MSKLRKKIAAQLYSVRQEFSEDPRETLKNLKEIGYQAVQIDGMRGHETTEIAELIKEFDFKIAGMHIKHQRFFDDPVGIQAEAELFGCKTLFDKYIEDEDQNEAGYRKTKKKLLQLAYQWHPEGYRLGLHNPEYDYLNLVEGRNILAFMTDPENNLSLYAEPDTYWMRCGEENPVEAFKAYSGRCPIVHLKDYLSGFDRFDMENSLTEVGSGEIDMEKIVAWGEKNKVEYYCVEQDYSKIGIFNSLQKSFDYLLQLEK